MTTQSDPEKKTCKNPFACGRRAPPKIVGKKFVCYYCGYPYGRYTHVVTKLDKNGAPV